MIYDWVVVDCFVLDIDMVVVFENIGIQMGGFDFQGMFKVQFGWQNQIGNVLWVWYNFVFNFKEANIQFFLRVEVLILDFLLFKLGWMFYFILKNDLMVGFIVVGSLAWEVGLCMGDVINQIDCRAFLGWYNDYCVYLFSVQAQFGVFEQMQVFKNGLKQFILLLVKV